MTTTTSDDNNDTDNNTTEPQTTTATTTTTPDASDDIPPLMENEDHDNDEDEGNSSEVEGEETKEEAVVKKVVPPTLPVEWTQLGVGADETMPLRHPHDVAELHVDDLDISIVGTHGQKITHIPKDFSRLCNPNLETLVLRSHLITTMQGLEGFTKLELLELYDNQVQALESLEGPGPTLRVLDMSYNSIRDMMPVSLCPNLKELYLANNKIKSMAGLSSLTQLKKLDLGANRIRIMDAKELGGLENLEELWIGKNKIEQIEGLEKLTKLRRLDVQSNRLTKVENLTTQIDTLEELFLAHNGIEDEGASCETGLALAFSKLNVLDLSRNRLTSTKPFAHLPAIEELWISGNQIADFDAVRPLQEAASAGIQSLETVYLEYNPVASEFEYRKLLKEWIPSLTQIDATMIGAPIRPIVRSGRPDASALLSAARMTPAQLQQAAIDRARQETDGQR